MGILQSVESFLPLTVISAVGLFFLKEVMEFFKKRSEKLRKIRAYKILIAEELQKNAWTIKQLKSLMRDIEDDSFEALTFSKNSVGEYRVYIRREDGGGGSTVLPVVHTSIFDKAVVEIAAIDSSLFEVAKVAYEHFAEVRHIRDSVITISEDEDRAEFLKSLPFYASEKLDAAEEASKLLFKACAGTEMPKHKLRSFA
ncbi:hypothetical protein P7C00_11205 [Pseudomonas sp. JDS08PS003]|uniref:hypothetical protein n=1 Tax=Pseudomonas sp. JDS08PS003 TaxID=2497162 RepID=UPI00385737F6